MTSPPDDTTADTSAIIAALRTERDAALAREAALAEELAARTAELATRNTEYGERIEQQTATIDVLKVMSASPGDAQPVFDLIVRHATELCDVPAATLNEYDGELVHMRSSYRSETIMASSALAAYMQLFPMRPTRGSITCRAILDRQIVHIRDLEADPELAGFVRELGHRSQVSVPLIRNGLAIGVISITAREPGGFSDSQIELLKTFAEQAVIAITSAETYRALQTRTSDLQETLEYQTATSDVLKVISSSNFALEPVFQTVVETAARLCRADHAVIFRLQDDAFRWAAGTDMLPEFERRMRTSVVRPGTGSLIGRVALQGRPVQILDRWTDPLSSPGAKDSARIGGVRSALGVPLVRDGVTIGAMGLNRLRVEPFTDRQIELVSTFADQAVIAIENTRLITEQREALEQQTATAEVLQVINSSPGDLKPVFDALLEKALRLCEAGFGTLYTYDGDRFQSVAQRGVSAAYAAYRERHPPELVGSGGLERAIRTRRAVQIADMMAERLYLDGHPNAQAMVDLGGMRTGVVVPLCKDETALGVISVFRQEVRAFSDKQIALLENFAAQAVIAMENARLINEQREALEQQTATAEVLRVINRSRGDLVPVFDAILESAHSLCDIARGSLELYDGVRFHAVAVRGLSAALADTLRQGYPASDNPATRPLIEGGRLSHIRDLAETDYSITRSSVETDAARTLLCVPLRRDETLLGMIASARGEVRPFSEKEITLLENFAAQAVIAMENARLINEQREALEQQTATAEVLQVINSSPGNLAPVFDAMLDKGMRLCGAAFGILRRFDGKRMHTLATLGVPAAYSEYMVRYISTPAPGTSIAEALNTGQPTQVLNMLEGAGYSSGQPGARAIADLGGARTVLHVPLVKDRASLGLFTLYRQEVRSFTGRQIDLLKNFAAQAVIAMENARLINEQREALEQQTATAEVLQVINSSPGNLQPVFEAILDKAHRICGAAIGSLFVYDGEFLRAMATHGWPKQFDELMRKPRRPTALLQNLIKGERLFHIPDLRAMGEQIPRETTRFLVDVVGVRTFLALPLRTDRALLGTITAHRLEVRPFSEKEIALLENFAAQAVIAMENARLLDEIRQRQEELRVTFDNMGDGVAMFDETQYLAAWNRKFQDILDLPDALLEQRRTYEEHLRFLAARGDFGPGVDTVEQIEELVASTGQPYGYERTRPDGRVIEIRRNPVPDGGFVLIYSDITERKRSEEEIRAARDAAETALRELRTAQANLIQAEKMASLGQLTAGIAHEIKNPLNFVNNFAELSVDLLGELKDAIAPAELALTEKQRAEVEDVSAMLTSNLEKITEHGKRADGIVKAMLEHSRGSSGERRIVDLNALIDEALNLAYHGARAQDQSFNITLERDFGEGMAPIEVNPQDITRVFLNLFANGFYAVTRRSRSDGDAGFVPTLKVVTRDAGEAVEIRVRDNGTGIPADIRDKLFQPFFTTKPTGEGTGLGLSITYDIVTQQHGGSIAVDSKVGDFSEFAIRLPRSP